MILYNPLGKADICKGVTNITILFFLEFQASRYSSNFLQELDHMIYCHA